MDEIKKAVDWLKSERNTDNGWGDLQGQTSRVINTAEAIIGIVASGDDDIEFHIDSLNYLSEAIIDKKCCKVAQFCWATMALLSPCTYPKYRDSIVIAIKDLTKTANDDGGWGYSAEDKISKVYPTTLALRTLILAKRKRFLNSEEAISIDRIITRGITWLISAQNSDGGWGVAKSGNSNVGVTSHALITLLDKFDENNSQRIQTGISWLISKQKENGEFPISEEDPVVGENRYNFVHFSTPWAIIALLKNKMANDEIVADKIKNAMKYLIELQDSCGGWKKTPFDSFPFIWATHNAIIALSMSKELLSLNPPAEKNHQELIVLNERLNFISSRNFIYASCFFSLSLYITIICILNCILDKVYITNILITSMIILGLPTCAIMSKISECKKIEAFAIYVTIVSIIVSVWIFVNT